MLLIDVHGTSFGTSQKELFQALATPGLPTPGF